jgi:predicted secreted hydrolase
MAHKRKGTKRVKKPPKGREKDNKGVKPLIVVMIAAVLILVPIAVILTSNEPDDNGEEPKFEIVFPRDEGKHNDSEEFWKVDFLIQNQLGDRFAINVDYYLHEDGTHQRVVTVTDEGNISGEEFFIRVYSGTLGVGYEKLNLTFDSSEGSDSWNGDYTLPYQYSYEGHVFDAGDEVYHLDLTMTSLKDPLLLGDEGKIFLENQGNAFGTIKGYMITRLSVTGTMRFSDSDHTITGYAWIQHEWGAWTLQDVEELRLQLSTASELFLTRFFDPVGDQIIEELVYYSRPDGQVLELVAEDYQFENLKYWIDPLALRCIPSRWKFTTTVTNTDITFHSSIANQIELFQWEGSVPISGMIDGLAGSGRGFVIMNHPYDCDPKVVSFYRDDSIPTDLYVNISNGIPMDTATAYYQVDGGIWKSVAMTIVSGDLWKVHISVIPGNNVKAYVEAYDLAGKKVTTDPLMEWTV